MNSDLKEVIQGISFFGGAIMAAVCLLIFVTSLVLTNYWKDDENARKKISGLFSLLFAFIAGVSLLTGYKPW